MFLEVVLLVLVVLVVVVLVVLIPGRLATWQDLLGVMRSNPNWQEDSDLTRRVIAMPEVLVLLVFITLIIAPLVEEAVKALGVALMSHRVRSASTALIFGLACGAGFAVAESLLNGAGATEPLEWGEVAVLRFGASLMHCLAGALMGLGWYYAIWQRKPWRLLGTYLLCLGIHILWNIVATAMGVVPVQLGGEGLLSPASIAGYLLGGLLLVYTVIMLVGLLWLARRVRPAVLVERPILDI
jgi:RsiW-degrading membrane proteinase PrsW (M82 family)